MQFNVTIEGTSPLIVNRFHEEAQAEATAGVHSRKEAVTPEEDARARLYLFGDKLYFPAENLRQSVITAAGRHKIGRRSATSDAAAALAVWPEAIPLPHEWTVDARAVVIPATKGRLTRYRPIFREWSLSFIFEVDTELFDKGLAHRVLEDAGRYVGIGDFRPQRKGPYGRFIVTSWEEAR